MNAISTCLSAFQTFKVDRLEIGKYFHEMRFANFSNRKYQSSITFSL